LNNYKRSLDDATKFIPFWVKIAVAIALGLGTMIGWKRIVVTVGEKIGKSHLTYGQGAAAELVAAATIFAADSYWTAGVNDPRAVVGRRWDHGRKRIGTADVDAAQHRARMGPDPAGGHDVVGHPVLRVQSCFLNAQSQQS